MVTQLIKTNKVISRETKNGQVEYVKVDSTKLNMTLATQLDLLSNGMNLFMGLPPSNRHHALDNGTLNILRKGNIDLGAVIGGSAEPTFSAGDIRGLIEQGEK